MPYLSCTSAIRAQADLRILSSFKQYTGVKPAAYDPNG
jgi:hypothetical protein